MIYRKSLGERTFDCANTLLLISLALVTLYPLLYVLIASVSDPVAMARGGKLFWSLKGMQLWCLSPGVFEPDDRLRLP